MKFATCLIATLAFTVPALAQTSHSVAHKADRVICHPVGVPQAGDISVEYQIRYLQNSTGQTNGYKIMKVTTKETAVAFGFHNEVMKSSKEQLIADQENLSENDLFAAGFGKKVVIDGIPGSINFVDTLDLPENKVRLSIMQLNLDGKKPVTLICTM